MINNYANKLAKWIINDLQELLNESKTDITNMKLEEKALVDIILLEDSGIITHEIAKDIFRECFYTGKSPLTIIIEKDLFKVNDVDSIIKQVLQDNQLVVKEYKLGKIKVLDRLIGQVMKITEKKADPRIIREKLLELLNGDIC